MILRAKYVVPVGAPPIENGAVAITGERITAVGRYGELPGRARDLGEVVLLPGLINAHCHLDYTDMRGQVPWRGEFLDWIHQITVLKKQWTAEQYRQSIQRGVAQAVAAGTTTVVNAGGSGETLAETTCRVWWCVELIDLVWSEESRRIAEGAARWVATHQPAGLAPHAPYTVSEPLYRLAAKLARERGWLLTTHVAESRGEARYWRAALGPNCLAAHANWVTEEEAGMLARTGASVAHCPRTHRFFDRPPAPVELWRRHAINICLGTDSLASNESLDLFAEMREFARAWPQVPAAEILRMVTVNGARALHCAGKLGIIAPGATADVIAVPATDADPVAAVLAATAVRFVMRSGKVVRDAERVVADDDVGGGRTGGRAGKAEADGNGVGGNAATGGDVAPARPL